MQNVHVNYMKELKEAQLREEKERKKALHLKEMKNMPVIKRTNELLNEINNNLSNLSEAKSKWDQYEEIINNIKSLSVKLEKAKADMKLNIGNEKHRRESMKIKLNNEINDANTQLKIAKQDDDLDLNKIKSIRNEIKIIKEQLENVNSDNTRNIKAEVENLQQQIEMKQSKINEYNALFDSEIELVH